MVKTKSNVKYHAKQIKRVVMRKDVMYLGMIKWNDNISLNIDDGGYNHGKNMGKKGTIYGPNKGRYQIFYRIIRRLLAGKVQILLSSFLDRDGKEKNIVLDKT